MKIAIIHYRFIHHGGLETRLKNYVNYLASRGHELTVICAKYDPTITVDENVKIVQLQLGWVPKIFRMLYFNYQLGKFMRQHSFDFRLSLGRTSHQDAVLCPGNHLGYLKAIKKKTKNISDILQIYLDKEAFKKTSIILAASEMIKEELIQYYHVDQNKILVLYPPLNTNKFYPPNQTERKNLRIKWNFKEGIHYFLFVSVGHQRKGISLLLEIFKKLKDEPVKLLIAGYPEVKTTLPHVQHLGFVKEMREIYIISDFLIHPSRYEPYGQIVAEALECNTPVIISKKVGAKEIVDKNEGIIIENFDVNLWVEKIKILQRDQFNIKRNSSQIKKLTLQNHMEKLMACADLVKN